MGNIAKRVLQAALAEPWAITAEGLELVVSVAARENEVSLEALQAYKAERMGTGDRLTRRGNVAIMEAEGPLIRRANMFSAISGATSYDVMRRDLAAAVDDTSVKAIVIAFNTPGGEVADVDELASAIREASAKKKIVAYVGGMACSAGYWLASQCTEIVISQTAMLGSIGVRAGYQDTSKRDAERGNIEYISSQSPGKRADHSTDEGRARIQATIDALADVFIATVAKGRGVSAEDVIAKFGGGDVLIGSAAVAAGMADRIGSFEAVISELAGRGPQPSSTWKANRMTDVTMAKTEFDAAIAAARAEGRAEGVTAGGTETVARIQAVLALDEAKDRSASALHLALVGGMTAEAAAPVLAGLPVTAPATTTTVSRAQDAPGGLVAFNPKLDAAPTHTSAKAQWGKVTDKINKKR